jgi:hypothetical protein
VSTSALTYSRISLASPSHAHQCLTAEQPQNLFGARLIVCQTLLCQGYFRVEPQDEPRSWREIWPVDARLSLLNADHRAARGPQVTACTHRQLATWALREHSTVQIGAYSARFLRQLGPTVGDGRTGPAMVARYELLA